MTIWIFILLSMTCAALGTLLMAYDKKNALNKITKDRLSVEIPTATIVDHPSKQSTTASQPKGGLSDLLGFTLSAKFLGLYTIALLLIKFSGWYFVNLQTGLFALIAFVCLTVVFLLHRRRKQRHKIVSQLPLFIDQLIRSLGTGRSIEAAIRLVAKDTPEPLTGILERVIRAADLGAGFTESLVKEMQLDRIQELEMVALSIKISNNYGSSPKDMLTSVMQMINNQEQARRELAAMTGETKISACILILTPTLILIYMILMNPGYIEMMTSSSGGVLAFKVAIGLQVAGTLLFWRMLKSL